MTLVAEGVVLWVKGKDILIRPRVVQAAHLRGWVQQLLQEVHQHHASPTPSTGAAKEDDLVLLLPDQLLHCFPGQPTTSKLLKSMPRNLMLRVTHVSVTGAVRNIHQVSSLPIGVFHVENSM